MLKLHVIPVFISFEGGEERKQCSNKRISCCLIGVARIRTRFFREVSVRLYSASGKHFANRSDGRLYLEFKILPFIWLQ